MVPPPRFNEVSLTSQKSGGHGKSPKSDRLFN